MISSSPVLYVLFMVAVWGIPLAFGYLVLHYLRRIAEATERLAGMRDR